MDRVDREMLDRAARLALRATGDVEPNPLVGCVLARRKAGGAWETIGLGHHRRLGGPHAEAEALQDCAARGHTARGATAWVTLEPCNHQGNTPPCSKALIEAGVAEVVVARADPNPVAKDGLATLAAAGVRTRVSEASALAASLSDPFVKRITTGLPWVIAKWAQTPDGRLSAQGGEPRWISCEASRRRVHRLRARVDAIVTGIGTALADDPRLTPRDTPRVRRPALRVVLDPALRLPPGSALATSVSAGPVVVIGREGASKKAHETAGALRMAGVEVLEAPEAESGRGVDLAWVVQRLRDRGASTVFLEAGPTLLRACFEAGLIDEAWAYVAGMRDRPAEAKDSAGIVEPRLADPGLFQLCATRRSGVDALVIWRKTRPVAPPK